MERPTITYTGGAGLPWRLLAARKQIAEWPATMSRRPTMVEVNMIWSAYERKGKRLNRREVLATVREE